MHDTRMCEAHHKQALERRTCTQQQGTTNMRLVGIHVCLHTDVSLRLVDRCSVNLHVQLGQKQLEYYRKRIVCEAALYTHI